MSELYHPIGLWMVSWGVSVFYAEQLALLAHCSDVKTLPLSVYSVLGTFLASCCGKAFHTESKSCVLIGTATGYFVALSIIVTRYLFPSDSGMGPLYLDAEPVLCLRKMSGTCRLVTCQIDRQLSQHLTWFATSVFIFGHMYLEDTT